MDFGKILDDWEKSVSKEKTPAVTEEMIDLYPPDSINKDNSDIEKQFKSIKKLERMKHQDQLDLHGYTVDEALTELNIFIRRSADAGYKKVLVIHGKGHHSDCGPVLAGAVRGFLESSPLSGRLMIPPERYGGTGALWVFLRDRS